MATTTPKFNLNDVVYIVASAAGRGFLESYKVDGISLDKVTGRWVYTINVARPPNAGVIVGGSQQLIQSRILYFNEAELTDYCTALNMCKDYLERALGRINTLLNGCSDGTA